MVADRNIPARIWEVTGITEHLGGVAATERLIALCDIRPGQRVLDIGCGSGYTACLLAKKYGAQVVAVDLSRRLISVASKRAAAAGVAGRVAFLCADANLLPFRPDTFDVVLIESVLIFCDKSVASRSIYEVLRRGGVLGDNELTLLRPIDGETEELLRSLLGAAPLLREDWLAAFSSAGFSEAVAHESLIRLGEQFRSHMIVDGPLAYFSSMLRGLLDWRIMKGFLTRKTLSAARKYKSFIGYCLYVCRK